MATIFSSDVATNATAADDTFLQLPDCCQAGFATIQKIPLPVDGTTEWLDPAQVLLRSTTTLFSLSTTFGDIEHGSTWFRRN
jgi:hypothetical protein